MRNVKPYKALPLAAGERSYWEVWLLIAFLVTILGIMAYAPVNSFPAVKLSSNHEQQQDPYGMHSDQPRSDVLNRVATGL